MTGSHLQSPAAGRATLRLTVSGRGEAKMSSVEQLSGGGGGGLWSLTATPTGNSARLRLPEQRLWTAAVMRLSR